MLVDAGDKLPGHLVAAGEAGPLETGVPSGPGIRGKGMNRFDVAWAGGFGGPDFFIFVGEGFYDAGEIVFGSVEGAASQQAVMAISRMKWTHRGENSMRFLDPPIEFDVGGG